MGDSEGSIESLVCDEARHTLNQQIERIEQADQKAVSLLRVNLLIAGIIVSSLMLIESFNGVTLSSFGNIWTTAGIVGLVCSTILASMTYSSSGYDIGIGPPMIDNTLQGQYDSREELDRRLSELYKVWLSHNEKIGRSNAYFITISILLVIDSMIFLLGGAGLGLIEYSNYLVIYLSFFVAGFLLLVLNAAIWRANEIFVFLFE